jgi:hypothetical protein
MFLHFFALDRLIGVVVAEGQGIARLGAFEFDFGDFGECGCRHDDGIRLVEVQRGYRKQVLILPDVLLGWWLLASDRLAC